MALTYRHPDYPAGDCVYCGETADTVDHLLPRNYTGEAERKIVPVVPACRECNGTLGDIFLPDVMERRELVQERYRRKYKRFLKKVIWGESDMEQFGPQIRTAITKGMIEHNRTMSRLAWPDDPLYDHKAWSACWDQELPEAN